MGKWTCGTTSEIRDKKEEQKKRPREVEVWNHKRILRPEREVDPQAKFETRKEQKKRPREVEVWNHKRNLRPESRKKNDPEKWIHKRNLRPERNKKNDPEKWKC